VATLNPDTARAHTFHVSCHFVCHLLFGTPYRQTAELGRETAAAQEVIDGLRLKRPGYGVDMAAPAGMWASAGM
jgi:hypothetical protein